MTEYGAVLPQTVAPNASVIFTESSVPCRQGLIFHRNNSGLFRLVNKYFRQNLMNCWRRNTNYSVVFHANISVPTGGTVGEPISLAIFLDGEEEPNSVMSYTPAVAETDVGNVGADVVLQIPYTCPCGTVSVRNISNQDITVSNANLVIGN